MTTRHKPIRSTLLNNYGPTNIFNHSSTTTHQSKSINNIQLSKSQIFPKDDSQYRLHSKSVATYGVENRDYYDQLRLKCKRVPTTQVSRLQQPMFKISNINGKAFVQQPTQSTKEIVAADFDWSSNHIGRINTEVNTKHDRNYAKIRRYLEGASSIIDNSVSKEYNVRNNYSTITNNDKLSVHCDKMHQTSSDSNPSKIQVHKSVRSTYQYDWIQRGK